MTRTKPKLSLLLLASTLTIFPFAVGGLADAAGSVEDIPNRPSVTVEATKTVTRATDDPSRRPESAPARTEGVAGGYVFVPINPYRTYDSRKYTDGYMLGGDAVYFDVLTDENGVLRIPAEAVAVTYNLTATVTLNSGFLSIYPADINWPGNSSINWTQSDQTLANGGTVAIGFLDAAGQVEVYCGPAVYQGTDFIIDITGYYI